LSRNAATAFIAAPNAPRLASRHFFLPRGTTDHVWHGACQLNSDVRRVQFGLQFVDVALQLDGTLGVGRRTGLGWAAALAWSQSLRSLWNRDSPMPNSAQASGTVSSPDNVCKIAFRRAFASCEASNPSTCFQPLRFPGAG
jgi:hypothetical protein